MSAIKQRSLNRVDRADRTTPLSNVSVINEIIAAGRLFPLRHINFDGRENTFSSTLRCAGSPAGCRAARRLCAIDEASRRGASMMTR